MSVAAALEEVGLPPYSIQKLAEAPAADGTSDVILDLLEQGVVEAAQN